MPNLTYLFRLNISLLLTKQVPVDQQLFFKRLPLNLCLCLIFGGVYCSVCYTCAPIPEPGPWTCHMDRYQWQGMHISYCILSPILKHDNPSKCNCSFSIVDSILLIITIKTMANQHHFIMRDDSQNLNLYVYNTWMICKYSYTLYL